MSNGGDRAARSSNGIKDITLFVENYRCLSDKLYPVFVVWDGVLYISRYIARCFHTSIHIDTRAHIGLYTDRPICVSELDAYTLLDAYILFSRWENYLLTLAVILITSILFYFPCKLYCIQRHYIAMFPFFPHQLFFSVF